MNHCVRLLLLFTPSLAALGLLGIAFATNWWTIALERNIPEETSLTTSSGDEIVHSTLIRVPISRGLFTECIAYRNVKVLVSDADFRTVIPENDNTANKNCSDYEFTCKEGFAITRPLKRCISLQEKCNHIVDCEDKSDEISCSETSNQRDNAFFRCPDGYIKCPDNKSCYRQNEQTCDGVSNCVDDFDEQNCNEERCQRNNHVYCPRENKCARKMSKKCDGIVHCADYSDEENCPQCDLSLISCDSKCLPMEYRCDGIGHCSDLLDESNCEDYTTRTRPLDRSRKTTYKDQPCMEHRFNPFRFYPPDYNTTSSRSYSNPTKHIEYVNLIFYLQLIVFYGIVGGLIFLLFAVISLFFFGCCRRHCISVPFYFYGFWMLLAGLLILTALAVFVFMWLWQKQTVLDYDKTLASEIKIHERNPTLRHIEFFGLSFWLACGAALATFIGLLLSYCVCCSVGSSRSDDKEYEIMQMHTY